MIETNSPDAILAKAKDLGLDGQVIGQTIPSAELKFSDGMLISKDEIQKAYEQGLPRIMVGNKF